MLQIKKHILESAPRQYFHLSLPPRPSFSLTALHLSVRHHFVHRPHHLPWYPGPGPRALQPARPTLRKDPAGCATSPLESVWTTFTTPFCLSLTHVFQTLLIVLLLRSTRQELDFDYSVMRWPGSSQQWQKSHFFKNSPVSDACWLFYSWFYNAIKATEGGGDTGLPWPSRAQR